MTKSTSKTLMSRELQTLKNVEKFNFDNSRYPRRNEAIAAGICLVGKRTLSRKYGGWSAFLSQHFLDYTPPKKGMSQIVLCTECESPVKRTASQLRKTKNSFCDHTCSAKYNNRNRVRGKETSPDRYCACSIKKASVKHSCCPGCFKKKKLRELQLPISHYIKTSDANKYSSIRGRARSIVKAAGMTCCEQCGYDLILDTCHIKPISEFPLDTPLGVVNDLSNLIVLCKNHHAELDRGHLTLAEIRKIK